MKALKIVSLVLLATIMAGCSTEHATMTIKGRTPQSNIIIKAKRMQQ